MAKHCEGHGLASPVMQGRVGADLSKHLSPCVLGVAGLQHCFQDRQNSVKWEALLHLWTEVCWRRLYVT